MVIIQLDSEQLSSVIQNAIRKVIGEAPKEPQCEADELLTVHQAAEFLTLAVPTLYSLISKGEVPVMKRSKRCYFLKQDLINYLKEGRKKSPAEIAAEASQYLNQKKRGLK